MARYFLEVMYDGTAFHGSQLQGSLPTVQLAINNALSILLRKPIETFGASRTDEGVHALCNYYHFDIEEPLHDSFHYKINAILSKHVAVNHIFKAINPEMNARFDALTRRYRYRIYNKKDPFLNNKALYFPFRIDTNILNDTSAILMEYENFESFSKRNTQTHTFLCKIHKAYWEKQGEEFHFIVEANRFLRGMVRGLVGTQLQVARGRMDIDNFRKIIEARDCTKADFSVAGHGLYLEHIQYPEGSLVEVIDKKR